LLPEAWEDLYKRFGSAKAPEAWRQSIARTAPSSFLDVQRDKEGMAQL